jgi:acetylornithine deacetylase/succinyl-diaminopimelate desuccinylase
VTPITIDRDEVVRLAQDLIAIESHSQTPGREAAIGRFLVDWFHGRGVEAELVPAIGDRANVIARLPLGGSGPTVLLNGHIDTVPAGAMKDAFTPRIEDGVLWGRGACDMKSAVAAMCGVLAAVARSLPEGQSRSGGTAPRSAGSQLGGGCALLFAGTVDEETGSLGVKKLVESGLEADYAVVGEPTSLRAAIAHKGACFIRIVLTGRGAHGSCPEKGVSAASYGARIVTALEDELRPRLAKRTYPLLGASTISVGRIAGGTEPNIVAERCEIDVDRRTLPGEADTVGEVQDVVAAICDGVEGLTYEVYETERTSTVPHVALGTSPDSPLALAAADACRGAGLTSNPIGVTYWTDGAHLAASGIETLILGPGDIADAHGPNDHARVDDIMKAAEVYLRIAQALLT